MRVMAAFTKFANLFTDMQEMMDYWLSDLPLPMLPTLYRWARDESMLLKLSLPSAIALNWCATMVCIRDYINQGQQIGCLDYKDLVQSPDKAWESLKKFCNISQHMTTPTDAFNKDSQRGAFLSRGVLAATESKKIMGHENWKDHFSRFIDAFEFDEDTILKHNLIVPAKP